MPPRSVSIGILVILFSYIIGTTLWKSPQSVAQIKQKALSNGEDTLQIKYNCERRGKHKNTANLVVYYEAASDRFEFKRAVWSQNDAWSEALTKGVCKNIRYGGWSCVNKYRYDQQQANGSTRLIKKEYEAAFNDVNGNLELTFKSNVHPLQYSSFDCKPAQDN